MEPIKFIQIKTEKINTQCVREFLVVSAAHTPIEGDSECYLFAIELLRHFQVQAFRDLRDTSLQ